MTKKDQYKELMIGFFGSATGAKVDAMSEGEIRLEIYIHAHIL